MANAIDKGISVVSMCGQLRALGKRSTGLFRRQGELAAIISSIRHPPTIPIDTDLVSSWARTQRVIALVGREISRKCVVAFANCGSFLIYSNERSEMS